MLYDLEMCFSHCMSVLFIKQGLVLFILVHLIILFQKQVMGQIFSFMKLLWKMNSKLKLWPKSTGFVKRIIIILLPL